MRSSPGANSSAQTSMSSHVAVGESLTVQNSAHAYTSVLCGPQTRKTVMLSFLQSSASASLGSSAAHSAYSPHSSSHASIRLHSSTGTRASHPRLAAFGIASQAGDAWSPRRVCTVIPSPSERLVRMLVRRTQSMKTSAARAKSATAPMTTMALLVLIRRLPPRCRHARSTPCRDLRQETDFPTSPGPSHHMFTLLLAHGRNGDHRHMRAARVCASRTIRGVRTRLWRARPSLRLLVCIVRHHYPTHS
jgi:hypothetical protein